MEKSDIRNSEFEIKKLIPKSKSIRMELAKIENFYLISTPSQRESVRSIFGFGFRLFEFSLYFYI